MWGRQDSHSNEDSFAGLNNNYDHLGPMAISFYAMLWIGADDVRLAWWQKESLPIKPGGMLTARSHTPMRWPHWLSFGTAGREGTCFPATLSGALSRLCLVYPLASLDVSGQWPVFHTDASPNEVPIYIGAYPTARRQSQEAFRYNFLFPKVPSIGLHTTLHLSGSAPGYLLG